MHFPGDVVDVGGFFGDILLDFFESVMLALIAISSLIKDHDCLRLGKVKFNPSYLIVQYSWILYNIECFIKSSSDLYYPLWISHQDKFLELFHLAVLILLLESSK